MQIPLQITYRNLEPSPAIEAAVRERAAQLESVCPEMMSCRIMIETPHRRRRKGSLFHVRIDMTVPGTELVVGRNPPKHGAHTDFYVALRDSFRAARRELEDYVRKRRGKVKRHELPQRGHVSVVFRDEGYGFLRTPENREVYFHQNSVAGDGFETLQPGWRVQFVEELGEKGPQATVVTILGPPMEGPLLPESPAT